MKETFKSARERLMAELEGLGWHVQRLSPQMRPMVRPWAKPLLTINSPKLYFRAQAVYVNDHSLHVDIRGMSVTLLAAHYRSHCREMLYDRLETLRDSVS